MSIDAKKFDKHKNPSKYIIEFLKNNSDKAFTAEHIAKEIEINVSEVRNTLIWEGVARLFDRTYKSPIETATVGGITYYKYKSV